MYVFRNIHLNIFVGLDLSQIRLKPLEGPYKPDPDEVMYESPSALRHMSPIDDFMDGTRRNPVPKPPRSHDDGRSTPNNEYMNLGVNSRAGQENGDARQPIDFDIDLMDRLDDFASAMDDDQSQKDEPLRPLPPIPDCPKADVRPNPQMTLDELDELYSKVQIPNRAENGLKIGDQNGNESNRNIQKHDSLDSEDSSRSEEEANKDVSNLEEGKFKIKVIFHSLIFRKRISCGEFCNVFRESNGGENDAKKLT